MNNDIVFAPGITFRSLVIRPRTNVIDEREAATSSAEEHVSNEPTHDNDAE